MAKEKIPDDLFQDYSAVFGPGKLTENEKLLIAFSVSRTLGFSFTSNLFKDDLLRKNISPEAIDEADLVVKVITRVISDLKRNQLD